MKARNYGLNGVVMAGVFLALAATVMPAQAGKLGSFEKSVGGSKSSSSRSGSSRSESSRSSSDDDSSSSKSSLRSFERSTSSPRRERSYYRRSVYYGHPHHGCWYCRYHHHCLFHYGRGYSEHHHVHAPPLDDSSARPADTNGWAEVDFTPLPGDPIVPMARFDYAWQAVEDDVEAHDFGLELGYSAVALRGRLTRYRENDPGDTLDLSSLLLLWRIPITGAIEFDVGFGRAELDGVDSQTGFDFSLALRGWIPDRRLGFEYRGEFIDIGDGLSSQDFCVLLHMPWFALRGGYRTLHSAGDSLDGPFVGASVLF